MFLLIIWEVEFTVIFHCEFAWLVVQSFQADQYPSLKVLEI